MKNNYIKSTCHQCKKIRKQITIIEIPIQMQIDLKDMLDGTQTFYYCEDCDEYSISSEWEMF
jgi:hypothetical protein